MLSEIVLRHSLAASPEAGRLHNPVGLAKQLAGALGRFFVQRPLHFSNLFFKLDVPGLPRDRTEHTSMSESVRTKVEKIEADMQTASS
eukprot:6185210-Pleurochrysis_carterae.AAC.2